MRKRDWADDEADKLFDLVRDEVPDDEVTRRIADALRAAQRAAVVEREHLEEARELLYMMTSSYMQGSVPDVSTKTANARLGDWFERERLRRERQGA